MASLTIESTLKLNDGLDVPMLSLGVYASSTCKQACLTAIHAGYRSIDTAILYRNEAEVGSAFKTSPIPRSSLSITSKVWHDMHTRDLATKAVDDSLKAMQLDYIDLYLVHNPSSGPSGRHQCWLGLQAAVKAGKIKSIGVSNFTPAHIECLIKSEGVVIKPAVNQVEMHPWNQQKEILAYCKKEGIIVQAYSPLTQGKKLRDPVIGKVAKKYGKTPAQIVLRWVLQQGVVAVPKSENPERIKENANIYDFDLDEGDLKLVASLDAGQKGNVGMWDPWAWK